LGIENTEKLSHGAPGARLIQTTQGKATFGLFMLYHLGGNHYRIIPVHSGLALEAAGSTEPSDLGVIQNWETPESDQRWTLARAKDGHFTVTNDATGMPLGHGKWRFVPVILL